MSQLINNILNINVSHSDTPIPVPHTDGGAGVPDTGIGNFIGDFINNLGFLGCGLCLVTLLVLASAIIFFLSRRKLHRKISVHFVSLLSIGLFAFAFGLSIPAISSTSDAISKTNQSMSFSSNSPNEDTTIVTNIDITVSDETASTTATAEATIPLPAFPHGYVISAYLEGDNHLYGKDSKSIISATKPTVSGDPDSLDLNSYGVKDYITGNYTSISTDPSHPTPLYVTDQAVPEGATTSLTYAVRLDSTVPVDTYTAKDSSQGITYVIAPAPTPKAILGENGNLNFVFDSETYTSGQQYEDNTGLVTIRQVYDVPKNATADNPPAWTNDWGDKNITSANFTDAFHNFKPTSTNSWFTYDTKLAHITNAQNLNTSNVTDMGYMFYDVGMMDWTGTFDMDLSSWNTSKVANMSHMFYSAGTGATTWSIGDLSEWDTSNVTDMSSMFETAGTGATTWSIGDLSNWDTSNVTDMNHMFRYVGHNDATWSIGDLSNWKTGKVTNMWGMFNTAGSKVTTWSIGNISNWDTSKVTNMCAMFFSAGENATDFTLDLSGWNTSNVENMRSMFGSSGVKTIYVGDDWNTDKVTDSYEMFYDATKLVGGQGTVYDASHTDQEYARIDDPVAGKPGYFTGKNFSPSPTQVDKRTFFMIANHKERQWRKTK